MTMMILFIVLLGEFKSKPSWKVLGKRIHFVAIPLYKRNVVYIRIKVYPIVTHKNRKNVQNVPMT